MGYRTVRLRCGLGRERGDWHDYGTEGDTAKAFGAAFSIADEKYKDSEELRKCLNGAFAFQSAALDMFSSPDSRMDLADSLWLGNKLKLQQPLEAVEARWDAAFLNLLVSKSRAAFSAKISLPKFEFQCRENLKDSLISMGLGVAFSTNANFSGISSDPLMLSDIIHKACIRVDEDGTEAVAATDTEWAVASAPDVFIADRPFLFALREKKYGLVLFVGRVVSP